MQKLYKRIPVILMVVLWIVLLAYLMFRSRGHPPGVGKPPARTSDTTTGPRPVDPSSR